MYWYVVPRTHGKKMRAATNFKTKCIPKYWCPEKIATELHSTFKYIFKG